MQLEDITNVKKQLIILIKRWDMSGRKYGLTFVMYNNLGFKIRGELAAGYNQYIIIAVLFIFPKQLQEIDFFMSLMGCPNLL